MSEDNGVSFKHEQEIRNMGSRISRYVWWGKRNANIIQEHRGWMGPH